MMKFFYILFFTITSVLPLSADNLEFTNDEKKFIEKNTFKVGLLNDLPPFGFLENGRTLGYSYDLLKLISKKSSLKFKYISGTWSENFDKFKNEEIDIIDSISYKKSRLNFTSYTEPYYHIPLYMYSRKDMPHFKNIERLKGKKIGLLEDVFFRKDVEDLDLFEIVYYKNLKDKLNALAIGEVDLILEAGISVELNIIKSGYTNIKKLDKIDIPNIKKEDLRLGVNKKKTILYSIVNKTFHSISKSEWNVLKNKWIDDYTKKNISIVDTSINLTKNEIAYIKSKKIIRVQNEKNWPPYNFNEKNTPKGFSIDYTNLLAQKLGLKVEYVSGYSWDEFLTMLRNGEIDVINNISKNKQRSEYISFTDVFHIAANTIYVKPGYEYIDSLKKLEDRTIVMPKGFFAQQLIEKHYPNIKQILVRDSLEALKFLSLGKADATVGKKNVIDYLISTKNISGVIPTNFIEDSRLTSFIRMGVSKEQTILRDLLQKAHNAVSDEQLLNLKRKWFGINTAKVEETTHFLSKEENKYLLNKNIITMCNFHNNIPIEFKDEYEVVQGISIDMIKLIQKELNISFKKIDTNSDEETVEFFKNKKCDILPAVEYGKKHFGFENITKPYINYKLAIITQKNKPIISSIEDIIEKSITLKKDSMISLYLKSNYPNINIKETLNDHRAIEAVNNGSAYYTIAPLPIASYYMSTYAMSDLYISRYTNIPYTVSMAVDSENTILLSILNKTLDHILDEDKKRVLTKWSSFTMIEKFDTTIIWKIASLFFLVLIVIIYRQSILKKHNFLLTKANKEIENKTIQLEKQKEVYKKLFTKSTDGVLLTNNKKIIACNESTLILLGFESKKELLTKTIIDLSPVYQANGKKSTKLSQEKRMETLKNGASSFEWIFVRKDGTKFWADIVLTSINIDDVDDVIHVVIRDINKKKEIEYELEILTNNLELKVKDEINKNEQKTNQLIHQSRLAQMGELISMIAHQWRQPLTSISATANNLLLQILLDKKIETKELEKEINLIADYSQHLSETIDDFRNFYKTDNIKQLVKIEDIVEKSLKIIGTSLSEKHIKVKSNFDCFKEINTYSSEINQVILNLLKNSEDALIEKKIENPKININTYCKNDTLILEISDNGGGIKEEHLPKLFDPYFSTKLSKEGSGLGLYMSKTIIEEHCNGELTVKNNNEGAIFTISLKMDKYD